MSEVEGVVVEAYDDDFVEAEPVVADADGAYDMDVEPADESAGGYGLEEGYKVEEVDDVAGEDSELMEGEFAGEGEGGDGKKKSLNPLDAMDGYTLMIALLVMSIVEFVSAIVAAAQLVGGTANDDYGLVYWAFSGGLLSILTVVALMVLKKFKEELSIKISPWLSIWLLVLWFAVVMPATFKAPFASFGNGYVGSWGSLIISGTLSARAFKDRAASVRKAFESQTQSDAGKWTMICGLAGIVVMIAAAFKFPDAAPIGTLGYAVSVAVLGIIGCVVVLVFSNVKSLKQKSGLVNTILSIFLAVWWTIGAFVLTFVNPFNLNAAGASTDDTGAVVDVEPCTGFNGYFATFGATFAALKLFQACGLDFVRSKMANLNKQKKGAGGELPASETEAPPL